MLKTLEIEPDSMDYLHAVADHYVKRRNFGEARRVVAEMVAKHPDNPLGRRMMRFMEETMERQ